MENKVSSKSIMLNYGLILGVASVLLNLTFYATGTLLTLGWALGLIAFAIMIVIIVMGIKKFKDENGGFVSWGQAVKIGVGIAIISALIGIIYNLIFNNFIDPEFQDQAMEVQRLAWEEANATTEQIEMNEGIAKTFSSPLILGAIQIVAAAFFGFIISAIAGAIMKKSEEDQY
jgi:amino acid transporter